MNILQAILMGIVQGLSEFLPISSSGHLVIFSNLYKYITGNEMPVQTSEEIFLDIMLHLGTLIAVLIYFRKDIAEIIKAFIDAVKTRDFSSQNAQTAVNIIFGTVITVSIAFPLREVIAEIVFKPTKTGYLLVITGIVLVLSELYSKRLLVKINEIHLKSSIVIAIAQGIAAFPGISRSGMTIAAGLFCNKDRVTAARYSFLLSIPIILGASVIYPVTDIKLTEIAVYNWAAIISGTIVAGIVGYLCVKYFLKLVGKYSLSAFGYYCMAAGVFTVVFFGFTARGI